MSSTKREEAAYRYLADLEPKHREQLVAAFLGAPPLQNTGRFLANVQAAARLTDLEPHLPGLLGLAIGLQLTATEDEREESISRFVESHGFDDSIRADLRRLAMGSSVRVSYKAAELQHSHSFPYSHARVLTQVRHVFTEGDRPRAEAAVICHALQIRSARGSGAEAVVEVLLDESDLLQLKDTVERALAKQQAVRSQLRATNMPYVALTDALDAEGEQ